MKIIDIVRLTALLAAFAMPATVAAATSPKLSVSVAVFDPAIPDDASVHRDLEVFPRIREVEAMLWPFQLRQSLVRTDAFRMVRVVPEPDRNAEVSVACRILQSDGFTLRLKVTAIDAGGNVWIDEIYSATVYGKAAEATEFQSVFDSVASDLALHANSLPASGIEQLAEISVLRYAQAIAPRAFEDYLDVDDDGVVSVTRLPARDDPMIERVRMVRATEFVINDVIDEAFVELSAEIREVHDLWREYRRQNALYQSENERRAMDKEEGGDRASFEHLKRLYDVYKWDRMTVQEQDRLAVAFSNEVGPRVEALESRIVELQIWIDRKYAEWNRLLEALFDVERRPEPVSQGAL